MSRLTALLLVLALWAAIYLPGLGSTELRGEEGRRILPAVTMLETGDWLVSYVGGKPFLRKPPLINWVIAISFKLTGVRNEWTARLPSALSVLAMGLTIVALSGPGWLRTETALAAAIMAMSTCGLLAKARFAGAEIEGLYAPLFGIAIAVWLAGWQRGFSPWIVWLVPGMFLGLGALLKGPQLHLLFFYAIVGAVIGVQRRWRALLHPAPWAGVALMAAIFLSWWIPYQRTEAGSAANKVWRDQVVNRVTEDRSDWASYASNLPRGMIDLLPWVLFAPVVVKRVRRRPEEPAPDDETQASWVRPVLWACVAMYVGLLLVKGVLPRYVLPLEVPLALVVATALSSRLVLKIGAALGVASIIYGLCTPLINRSDDLRPLAAAIDAKVPPGATLTLYDPGYQAWIFYLRSPYAYAPYLEDVPASPSCVLARGKERKKFAEKRPDLVVVETFKGKKDGEFLLLAPGKGS